MVKLNPLSSYDAEDCYRAIKRLATGKKWSKQGRDSDSDSETVWVTNELNSKKKFFRNVETLNAAKQNVGEALAMAELSLMATSAYAESSSSRKSSKKKRLRHYGHFKFRKDARSEKESKEDFGYFSRHSKGRTFEHEVCRDRVNRARSFQVRRSTSHEDMARTNTKASDAQGKNLRRSSSDRVRPHPNSLLRSSSTGASQSPVEKRRDRVDHQSKSSSVMDGRTRRPGEDMIVTDPDTGIKYNRGKLLGKGGFAKCFEFSDVKTKEKFAVKVVNKNKMANPRTREKIIREIEIHRHLEHPNVVTFYGFFESKGAAYLILENCVQRSMVHVLMKRKTLTEPEVRYYMLQLISGCRYIHGRKIIHRDLKLGNMLLDDQMKLKIADFGLATKVLYDGEKKTSLCGTPNYIAPEVLQKKGHSYEADIWALGCVMFTMLCGQPPFETKSLKETYHRIINSQYTTPGHVTDEAAQLMKRMLTVDPSSRPSLVRISTDKFFLLGYTPSTLSTFCCHTPPRFPLTSTMRRSRSLNENNSRKSKEGIETDIQQTRHKQTQTQEQRKTTEKQQNNTNKNNRKTTTNEKPKDLPGDLPLTIAVNDSYMRSLEKTFRILDIKNGVRSSEQVDMLDKMAAVESDSCNLTINNTQSQHTSNDTKVCDMLETSFEPLFELMKQTVKQHEAEGSEAASSSPPSSPSSLSSSSSMDIASTSPSSSCPSSAPSPLWITKWVDYSNKYGFGYQLSDGRIGILFSDSGHILRSQDGKSVNYTSRLNRSKTFSVENVPSKLQRKLRVVENLAEYMIEHLVKGGDLGGPSKGEDENERTADLASAGTVLLQKWYRDSNVILMQLNNGTLQANCFKDHSKIILSRSSLSTGDYLLTYVSRGRPPSSWSLVNPTSNNSNQVQAKIAPEVIERIRLALTLISHAEHPSSEPSKGAIDSPEGIEQESPRIRNKFKSSVGDRIEADANKNR